MSLPRAQWRTAAAWRDYDRANFWVLAGLFGAFVVWMLWQQTRPPMAEPSPADSPVRMLRTPDIATRLDLRVVGSRLELAGDVPDPATSAAVQQAAEAAFGAGRVDNRLTVRNGVAAPWLDHLPDMMRSLRDTGGQAALRVEGRRVTLTGEVPQERARAAREMMAQMWFGRSAQVDNQLRVTATATATASGAAVASAPAGSAAATALPAACVDLASGVTVRFHPNAPALTDEGRRTLRELLPCLAQGRWRVGVHTDTNGDAVANMSLTQGRADAVVAYLVGRKLPADRLVAVGYGASRPLAGNDSPEGRLRNRRVTFETQP